MASEALPAAHVPDSPPIEEGEGPAKPAAPPSPDRVAHLVQRHQRALFAYLGSLGCGDAQAEDLVQDAFVVLLKGAFVERDEASTRAWLRTAVRSRYLDHLRRANRAPSQDLDEVDAAWRQFDGDDGGASYRKALRTCLTSLEERERRALELRYGEARERSAIAEAVGLSVGGVKALLSRARARLKTCIERRLA